MRLLVTGGAGFIGSHFVDLTLAEQHEVWVLDSLTYAGRMSNLNHAKDSPAFHFVKADILETQTVLDLLTAHSIDALVHFAAESHVDRSITSAADFIQTNIVGTFSLLQATRQYWEQLPATKQKAFRYLQVSTDEVYGSLGTTGKFSEQTAYDPRSPYSASKAASDHLVSAWFHTYGLPTVTTHCSNNYGPRQFPEKLIPHMIACALSEKPLPVYGDGLNVRDWIHVEDHCRGILSALHKGTLGSHYCFGGNAERKNIDLVETICKTLDHKRPRNQGRPYRELIRFVEDRLGHDRRYAIDDSLAQKELGFSRKYDFESGLEQTIEWYLQ